MAIQLKVIKKRDPRNLTMEAKYHGVAVATDIADLEYLSEKVSAQSSMSEADVYAVLIALESHIIHDLKKGAIVRLGRLGSFQVGVSTHGSTTKEAFSAKLVHKSRILFRPGKGLKKMLKILDFSIIPYKD